MLKKVQIFKALDVEIKKQKGPVAVKEPYRGYHSLKEELSQPGITIVAEVAGGNPLRGQVRENFRASTHAKSLVENGAKALSVATDRFLYYGEDRSLPEVRPLVKVPVLRRDFILEEYQVEESKILGSDAIYLVAAMLETERLSTLNKLAIAKGLDVVIEVSSEADLARALEAGAEIICVVGRDLDTWEPSWELAIELLGKVPEKQCLRMVEAGIQTLEQIRQIEELGVHGVIIGDVLLDEFYPGKRLAQILSGVEVARKPVRSKAKAGVLSDSEPETSAAGGRNAVKPRQATIVKPQPPSKGEKELPVAKLPVASKKAEPKAVPPAKTAAPKAAPPAKAAVKKAAPKAAAPAKPAAKKAAPKAAAPAKPAVKKAAPKAAAPAKPAVKKAAPKAAAPAKPVAKKAAPKAAAPAKPVAKKAAPKAAAPAKPAVKKAAPKAAAPAKPAVKKAAPKAAAPAKPAVKKAAPKAAAPAKPVAKKAAPKAAAPAKKAAPAKAAVKKASK